MPLLFLIRFFGSYNVSSEDDFWGEFGSPRNGSSPFLLCFTDFLGCLEDLSSPLLGLPGPLLGIGASSLEDGDLREARLDCIFLEILGLSLASDSVDGSLSLEGYSSCLRDFLTGAGDLLREASFFRDFLTGAGDLLREDSDFLDFLIGAGDLLLEDSDNARFLGILGDSDRSTESSDASILGDSNLFFSLFLSLSVLFFGLGDSPRSDPLDSFRGFLVLSFDYLSFERVALIGFSSSSESILPSFQKIYSPSLSLSSFSFENIFLRVVLMRLLIIKYIIERGTGHFIELKFSFKPLIE